MINGASTGDMGGDGGRVAMLTWTWGRVRMIWKYQCDGWDKPQVQAKAVKELG